jgi:biotin carboxylase
VQVGRRKLGILYEPESVDVMALARTTAERWPLVWLVDARTPQPQRPILARLGEVIDTASRSAEDLSELLAVLGVAGLTTFADASLERLAEIAEALGVVHNSAATSRCLVDKLAERDALAAYGLPVPRYHRVDSSTTAQQLAELLDGITYPLVLKPARGTGGRLTVCVADLPGAAEALALLTRSRPGAAFVVEECLGSYPPNPIDGVADYVSVELACDGDRHELLAITGRMPLEPPFREGGHFIPAGLEGDSAATILSTASRALTALGVRVGCVHVEIKLTPEGPRIIEVNGRAGGGGIRDLLIALGASDPYLLAAELAMGETPSVTPAPATGPMKYTFALQPPLDRPARLVTGWREQLDALPGVTNVRLRSEAHTATIAEGAYGYLVLVSGTATDRRALVKTHTACAALIEPVMSG